MLIKKILIIGIIILFLVTVINQSVAIDYVKKPSNPISNGKTLYVGGTGEGNYTTIQEAINDATDGDTVFVYDEGSPYYEFIIINKSINLIGEDRNSTIIERNWKEHVINILAKNVLITGFTIQDRTLPLGVLDSCIYIKEDYAIIRGNIIKNRIKGIYAKNCNYSSITNNSILSTNGNTGIYLKNTQYCEVSNNTVKNNNIGIHIEQNTWYEYFSKTIISHNTIFSNNVGINLDSFWVQECNVFRNCLNNNKVGFEIESPRNNEIFYNIIENSTNAIYIRDDSSNNCFYRNNIIRCKIMVISYSYEDIWKQNYWNRPRIFPKPIIGKKILWIDYPYFGLPRPCLMFDWCPAKAPYEIDV